MRYIGIADGTCLAHDTDVPRGLFFFVVDYGAFCGATRQCLPANVYRNLSIHPIGLTPTAQRHILVFGVE